MRLGPGNGFERGDSGAALRFVATIATPRIHHGYKRHRVMITVLANWLPLPIVKVDPRGASDSR